MKIYLASSWRNVDQPAVLHILRRCGHTVYDFRNPHPNSKGFNWADIDPQWQDWTPTQYAAALEHPIAAAGYALDKGALIDCEACVLLLPSGRSASWEFGFACGSGKPGAVVMFEPCEPELMYSGFPILAHSTALFDWAVAQPGGKEP